MANIFRWVFTKSVSRAAPASIAVVPEMKAQFEALFPHVSGRVLEIGPGSGVQVPFFEPYASQIDSIYGAEPVEGLHAPLREAAAKAGLGKKYKVLGCGAEPASLIPALAKEGLLVESSSGVFDTIYSLRVLCSVPEPLETVKMLYRLLAPGGKLVVYEHLKNEQGGTAAIMQRLYMAAGWRFVWGDCTMLRKTLRVIKEAAEEDGGWAKEDVTTQNPWSCIPYGIGVYTKKG